MSHLATDYLVHDLDIAPPSTIRAAIHDFAGALVNTREYIAFESAAIALQQDVVAQAAIDAYQSKVESLRMMLMLNSVGAEERAELEDLRQAFACAHRCWPTARHNRT